MKINSFGWSSLGLLALLMVMPATSADSPKLPRYQLEVGQELVYEGSSRFKYQNGSHGTTDKTTFWVTSKNEDGSWHLIAQNENTFSQTFGSGQESPGRKDKALDAFDLYSDGRTENVPQGFKEKRLTSLFFRLPTDEASARRLGAGRG